MSGLLRPDGPFDESGSAAGVSSPGRVWLHRAAVAATVLLGVAVVATGAVYGFAVRERVESGRLT